MIALQASPANIRPSTQPAQLGCTEAPRLESRRFSSLTLLLFLSGAAALIYEVLWIKQLSLVVGVDVYAITTGVSAFFAGLGCGGYWLGNKAERSARPLLFYALLEIGIAVTGVAATLALARASVPFAQLEAKLGLLAWILPFTLVAVPAFVMGGTLPVLVRSLSLESGTFSTAAGSLYAANTAGGIVGALLSPFVLLPWLGVRHTAFAAAALNLAAATGAFALHRLLRCSQKPARSPGRTPPAKGVRLAFLLYALAGGIALGYEVIWSQAVVQFLSTRSFAFAIVLGTYLAGLVTGSAWYARIADRVRDPWGIFGLLIALAGLVSVLEFAVLGNWLMNWQSNVETVLRFATGSELAAMCGRFVLAAFCIVFPPTVLLGAAFPAALRLTGSAAHASRDVGTVVGLNTAGGIGGTFLTGFLLIPAFGLVGALGMLAMAAAVVGIVAAANGRSVQPRIRRAIFAAGAVSVLIALLTPNDQLARLLPRTRSGGEIVFYQESPGGTVAVVEQRAGPRTSRRLYIQGVSNSGDTMTSLRYMRLQALLPLLIQRQEPHSALVIGFGTGITVGSLLAYPGLDRRVAAELLPAVVSAAPLFHGNLGAASNSRIDTRLRDGRRELIQHQDKYDLITLEPPPPSAAGVVNLYSSDFYRLARTRLQPGGLLAQWLPLPTQNDEDSRSLVRSFLDSFPYASLWTTEIHEMLLIGSLQPMELDVQRIATRFHQPPVSAVLGEIGISSPAALLATWVTGRVGLERYAAGAPAVTDDRPGIEYATWVRRGELLRTLPNILAVRTDPPIVNADETFVAEMTQQRRNLQNFYEAALHAYRGEREPWARCVQAVLRDDPANPYYRWIIGESAE